MCVRCGTGRIAWCTDPYRHGESAEPVSPGDPPAPGTAPAPGAPVRKCCGLPMSTLDVFGVRLYQCTYRQHPLVFRNLNTGEELTELYEPGDGGLEWTQHYPPGSDDERN